MNNISKKLLRDMLGIWVRVLFISAIVGLGIATYSAGNIAHDSLINTRDNYFNKLHMSDLELWITSSELEELPDFSKIPEVGKVVRRYFTPGYLEKSDGKPLILGLIYLDPSKEYPVNNIQVIDGEPLSPDDPYGVIIERTMAEIYNYKVGDKLVLNPYHSKTEVRVRGIGVSPEFLIPTSYPDVFVPAKGSLGVVFMPMQIQTDTLGTTLYNDLCFKAAEGINYKQLHSAVLDSLKGKIEINKIISRDRQYAVVFLDTNLDGFNMFVIVNVTIFSLIAFLVTLLTVRRVVLAQEVEIGTLMALGYSSKQLFRKYLLIGIIIGLIGMAFGSITFKPLADTLATRFGESLGLPEVIMAYDLSYLYIGLIAGFVVSVISTAIPLLAILQLDPQHAIRGIQSVTYTGLPKLVQPVIDIFAFGSKSLRFALRNMFRRPGLTAAIVFLIATAISVSTSFKIALSSYHKYSDEAFMNERWDGLAAFRVPLTPEELEPIAKTKGLRDVYPFVAGSGTIIDGNYERELRILGVPPPQGLRYLPLLEGHLLTAPNSNEIIINVNYNQRHKFKTGSKVLLKVGDRQKELTVVALMNDSTLGIAYMPIETAREMLARGDKYDGLNVTFDSDVTSEEMEKRLYEHEMVSYVSLKTKMKALANEFMKIITSVVEVSLGVSYLFAILFMFIGISMSVLERVHEYATLRSLGYSRRMIYAIIYYEISVEGALALLFSIPMTFWISEYMRTRLGDAWFMIDFSYDYRVFLQIMIPALVLLLVAVLPFIWQVMSISLADALRQKSFD